MNTYIPYVSPAASQPLPRPVSVARVLLYAGGALSVLLFVAYLATRGVSGATVGTAIWNAWPGVLAMVAARRIRGGDRAPLYLVYVVCAFWALAALAAVGTGDPRGLTQLILPVALLICVTRPSSRIFFAS